MSVDHLVYSLIIIICSYTYNVSYYYYYCCKIVLQHLGELSCRAMLVLPVCGKN